MFSSARRNPSTRRDTLLRVAIIAAVIALSALIAYTTPSGRNAILMLALPLVAMAAAFFVRKPGLGVITVVVAGLVVPFSLGTGTGTSLNPVILLVPVLTGLWLTDMIIRQRSIQLRHHPSVYLALAFAGVSILAFIAGQLPWYNIPGAGVAAQLGGLLVYLLSVGAFLLSAHTMDERRLKQMVAVILLIAAVFMATRVLPGFGFANRIFDRGAVGSLFWTWTVAFSAGMALFNTQLRGELRLVLFGLAGATLLIGVIQSPGWASGWAPSALALLILLWLRFPRWGWLLIVLAIAATALQWDVLWNAATDAQAWFARRQAWEIVLSAAMVNPLLGLGPSNYYYIVEQYTIGGWGGFWNVRFNSHNNYVDIIAQTGFIGLAIFLAFAVVMGNVGWKVYRQIPGSFTRAYAAACIAGLVATLASGMLGDWFLPFTYNVGLAGMRSSILFWIFMGGLLALAMRTAADVSASSPSTRSGGESVQTREN